MAEHKHITEPDKWGYQVRISVHDIENNRYFSHRQWGGKDKSLQAAINYRDQILALSVIDLTDKKCMANNRTTGINGVTYGIMHDKRRDADMLVYQAHYKQGERAKNRKFCVGRTDKISTDDMLHAFNTAKRFRRQYELSVLNKTEFRPQLLKAWKKNVLY